MIEYATLIFLILIFVAAEIHRARRGVRGVIASVKDTGIDPMFLPVTPVNVRLENGSEVIAQVNCCTACLGRLKIGDHVRVSRSKEGYTVDLPWIRKKICSSPDGAQQGLCRADTDKISFS